MLALGCLCGLPAFCWRPLHLPMSCLCEALPCLQGGPSCLLPEMLPVNLIVELGCAGCLWGCRPAFCWKHWTWQDA